MKDIENLLRKSVARVTSGETFNSAEMTEIINALMTCDLEAEPFRILAGSFICSLKTRGETVDELVGAARSLQAHLVPVEVTSKSGPVMDTC